MIAEWIASICRATKRQTDEVNVRLGQNLDGWQNSHWKSHTSTPAYQISTKAFSSPRSPSKAQLVRRSSPHFTQSLRAVVGVFLRLTQHCFQQSTPTTTSGVTHATPWHSHTHITMVKLIPRPMRGLFSTFGMRTTSHNSYLNRGQCVQKSQSLG